MTLAECIQYCAGVPELVREFDRLDGSRLATLERRSALDAMIDQATGREAADAAAFAAFVAAFIWLPLYCNTRGDEDA